MGDPELSLEANITTLLHSHSEERRAKRLKFENYALTLERLADTGDAQEAAMREAAVRLRTLAAEIYP